MKKRIDKDKIMEFLKNKKFFNVLNSLDITIIALVLILLIPALHYYVMLNEKGVVEQKMLDKFIGQQLKTSIGFQTGPQAGYLDVNVSFKNIEKDMVKKIKLYDKEVLPDGTVLAEIVWLGNPRSNYFIVDLTKDGQSSGALQSTSGSKLYSIPAKLRVNGIVQDYGSFFYKGKLMKQLGLYTFKSGDYEVDFTVELVPVDNMPKK